MYDRACIVMIKDRYFHEFKPDGRLDSRPCFAGATLFGVPWIGGRSDQAVYRVTERLMEKGYRPRIIEVIMGECLPVPDVFTPALDEPKP